MMTKSDRISIPAGVNSKILRAMILSGAVLTAALVTPIGLAIAADDVTEDQILRALAPKKPLTRGLSVQQPDPARAAAETQMIDALRNRKTRSLSSGERQQIAEIAKDKPNIDLEITFDYNSADISRQAEPAVQALGKALSNPSLRGSTFVVAGHTDGAGGEGYNQDLSERRADAIKRVLVQRYGLTSDDLVTVGYGKSAPKDPSNPMSAANRRVQVVNMQNKTASRQ
ncbi:MAG: OmpA/MotB [Tardiphaga sp.]|jgi:outer membrane protein OmpA-like peptidoglycan-associated protein|nr:OmpA/MotB [Tardiphaga sp.]MDB5629139.1 OmpA/MotB [Tardiphaga sp.]